LSREECESSFGDLAEKAVKAASTVGIAPEKTPDSTPSGAAGKCLDGGDEEDAPQSKGRLTEHLIPADAEGVRDFAAAVVSIWPAFEWRRLLKGEVENLRDFKN
jgi:hypothetical protein